MDATDIWMKCLEIVAGCSGGYPFNYFDIRGDIYKRDSGLCQICGKKGRVCHHIDYSKYNNSPNNLIILCGKCHAKTNFDRNYWQKYFQDKKASPVIVMPSEHIQGALQWN